MWTNPTAEAPAAPAPAPAGLSLRLVFHTIRRHTLPLIGILLLAGTVGCCIWLFLPLPKKTAAVLFHLSPHEKNMLPRHGGGDSRNFDGYRRSQMDLVKLRTTLNAALDDESVRNLRVLREAQPDRLTWLENHVSVDARGGAEYMRITIAGDEEDELKKLVGAVAKAYLASTLDNDVGGRQKNLDKLKVQLKESEKEIETFYTANKQLADELGATDAESLDRLREIRSRDLESALQRQEVKRRAAERLGVGRTEFVGELFVRGVERLNLFL